MKKLQIAVLLVISILMVTSCSTGKCPGRCQSGSDSKCKGKRGLIELSGVIQRPVKGLPQIYLGEYGKIRRIDLKGKKIEDLKDGTPVKIYGSMRCEFFEGGKDELNLAKPAQWEFWIQVKDVEVLDEDPI